MTGFTTTVRVTALLVKSPSLITKDTVRMDHLCMPVGSSDQLENVTALNAACQSATDTLPASDSTPAVAL